MGHSLLVFGVFICVFRQCISKKQQRKPKQQTEKRNGGHLRKEINQILSFYCNNYWHTFINECFFCLLLLWTVGQMCLTKCSPPKYLQNRIIEHIALFTLYEATAGACPLPRPPTHTFYLFSVHNVTWPRIYLCFSLSPASLRRACWSCVSTVWCPCLRRFFISKGLLYHAHYFWPDASHSRHSTLLEMGVLALPKPWY